MQPLTTPPIYFVQGDDLSYVVYVTQGGLASRLLDSTTLTGSNTFWNSSMNGCNITFPDGFTTTIAEVTSYTTLTMATPALKTDALPVIYSAAMNITGYSIYFTVKENLNVTNDSTALIELPPITNHIEPTQGVSNIIITHEQSNIPPGTYFYDIRVVDTNSDVMSVKFGQATCYLAITQRVVS